MLAKPNRLLRKLGYEVRRLPRSPGFAPPPDQEREALEAVLTAFAASCSPDSSCADVRALRRYLSNRRIVLFNDLLAACRRHGVVFDGRRIADLGCGTGYLLRLIHQAAPEARLAGFDTYAEMLGLARRLCPVGRFEQRSLFDIEQAFDVLFCTETLEHLEQPADALRSLFACTAPRGALVITVPDGRKDQQACGARRAEGGAYWGHIHFWSPESWRLFLERELGDSAEVLCGQCVTSENYAVLLKSASP